MGCAGVLQSKAADSTRAAAPVAIDESLTTLDDPAVRARVAQLMGTAETQRAVRELGSSAVDGVIDGASSTRTEGELTRLTARLSDVAAEGLVRGLEAQQTRLTRRLTVATAGDATRAASRAAVEELRTRLGPALRESMVDALRSPDLREAIDQTVTNAGKSAAAAIEAQRPKGAPPLLERLQNLVTFAWLIALGLAVGLAILFIRELRGRWRAEAKRRAIAEELVVNAIEGDEERPWSKRNARCVDQSSRAARRGRPGRGAG